MRVAVFPADKGGCGYYRLRWPAAAAAAQGGDVSVVEGLPGVHWSKPWVGDMPPGDVRVVGCDHPGVDVVVLQRPLTRHLVDVIPHLQAHGVAVVVEVDDDFSSIHPSNPAFARTHPKVSPLRNWRHLASACAAADLVTVTTPALAARYGAHGRVAVLPNCVPASYLTVPKPTGVAPVVGWSGSVATHPGDLQVTRGAVGRVIGESDAVFHVVGTGAGVTEALNLRCAPTATGWVDIGDYPHALSALDVGVVPLADTKFNHAKSALKMLEYAAVGVVPVVSPTPDNLRVHKLGVGLVARRPREWESAIRLLIRDADLRARMAEHGREAASRLTVEHHAWRWMDAWSRAAARRRSLVAA